MPEDSPRSAYEIAMEKLLRKDREEGVDASAPLNAEQKEAISEIRHECEAKLAELEIMHATNLRKAAGAEDPSEAVRRVEEGYQRDRRRIEDERDARIAKARGGTKT